MAQGIRNVCGACGRAVEAWSDGNPYYIDRKGAKQYAYHPDHDRLARCIGNDLPHLCLSCGDELMVDSRNPTDTCPACGADDIAAQFELQGCRCPFCKAGTFEVDADFNPIS